MVQEQLSLSPNCKVASPSVVTISVTMSCPVIMLQFRTSHCHRNGDNTWAGETRFITYFSGGDKMSVYVGQKPHLSWIYLHIFKFIYTFSAFLNFLSSFDLHMAAQVQNAIPDTIAAPYCICCIK